MKKEILFLNAELEKRGDKWLIVIVEAGTSAPLTLSDGDGGEVPGIVDLPLEVVQEAVPLADGIPVQAFGYAQETMHHLPGRLGEGKQFLRDTVGITANPRMEGKRLVAELDVVRDWFRLLLLKGWRAGAQKLVQFSAVFKNKFGQLRDDGQYLRGVVEKITEFRTIDAVGAGALGGKVIGLLAEKQGVAGMDFLAILKTKAPDLHKEITAAFKEEELKDLTPEVLKDKQPELHEKFETWYAEFLKAEPDDVLSIEEQKALKQQLADVEKAKLEKEAEEKREAEEKEIKEEPVKVAAELRRENKELKDRVVNIESMIATQTLDTLLTKASLSEKAESIVRRRYEGKIFEVNQVKAEIQDLKELGGPKKKKDSLDQDDDILNIVVGAEEYDKRVTSLEGLLAGWKTIDGIAPFQSIKQFYMEMNEKFDPYCQGRVTRNRHLLVQAAITTATWTNILEDAINKRMADLYPDPTEEAWRLIARTTQASDFKNLNINRVGGYGVFSVVGEGANYPALTSPGEEGIQYAVQKRGGTDSVTWETIRNDDTSAVQKIPLLLTEAARETLEEYVFTTLVVNNPTFDGDSKTFFHADHNNTGTLALTAANLIATMKLMAKQTQLTNSKRLNIQAAVIAYPIDLLDTVDNLLGPTPAGVQIQETTDATAKLTTIRNKGLKTVQVPHWTDTDDWYLFGDIARYENIEIAFLDGQETPEVFVKDQPTSDTFFVSEKVEYKIRHIYAGDISDFRAAQRNNP